METSARNELPGTVKSIELGSLMARIVIDVGGHELVAEMSRAAARWLGLKKGDAVCAMVKSTQVIVGKLEAGAEASTAAPAT